MTNKTLTVIIPPEYAGKTLMEALGKEGFFVSADCGGAGRCGKCTADVLTEDGWQTVRSCRHVVPKDGETVRLKNSGEKTVKTVAPEEKSGDYKLAFDIGTTTLEAALVSNGRILRTASILNPQKIHGADVLSRINFASEKPENTLELEKEVKGGLGELMKALGVSHVSRLSVCGNPTMTHFFCGIFPENAGEFPYVPEFSAKKTIKNDVFADETVILPASNAKFSGSAFRGSDAVAATAASKLGESELLVDLGTNGEIVFKRNGRFFAGSTAAGPCFEGGNISCGTGGVSGAVSHAELKNGVFCYKTIGDAKPVGVCGAGLTDIVAVLLEMGKITPDGYMAENFEITGIRGHRSEDSGLYITPGDVRAFQLAKAAVSAGIDVVLEAAGATKADVAKVYVAGNFGKYMNAETAVKTGIFPEEFRGKTEAVGNAALIGAAEYAIDAGFAEMLEETAENMTVVDVGGRPSFNEKFIEKINFTEVKNDSGI